MAICNVSGNFPTLSEIALGMRVNQGLTSVTRSDVLRAVREREVPIYQGRVSRDHLAAIYFGLCDLLGVATSRPQE